MTYYWNVKVSGYESTTIKAVKAHTAVASVIKRLSNQTCGRIEFVRMDKVERVKCECGKIHDIDDKESHLQGYRHMEFLKSKGEQK